jgi:hypothetical protein
MFIDWNEVLVQALIWGVLGAVGGALASLMRKPEAKTQAESEARERARIEARAGADRSGTATIPFWFVLLVIVAIVVGVLLVNPSLIGRRP